MKTFIARLNVSFFVFLHNVSYRGIGRWISIAHDGAHPKHEIMKYYQFFVDHVADGDLVIDVGCGQGITAYHVSHKSDSVVGIDISLRNIRIAQKRWSADNLTFVVADALTYKPSRRFDKIILSNVLEHIKERVAFLQQLHMLSDVILLRVPLITRDWLAMYKREQGLEYRLDPTHYIEYTLDSLQEELRQSGWAPREYSVQWGELWGVIISEEVCRQPV